MDYDGLWESLGLEVKRLHTCVKCLGGVDWDEYDANHFVCDHCRDNWDAFPLRTWSDKTQRTPKEKADAASVDR